jgi:hypothetical protein
MTLPKMTQSALQSALNDGKSLILAYRTVFEIRHSHGVGGLITPEVYRDRGGLPLTRRGRYQIVSVEYANRIIGHEIFVSAS